MRLWDVDGAFPATNLPDYCRKCRESGGCKEACPRPTLLPENLPALSAFDACDTQWRVGFDGKAGLDNTACIATLELYLPRWQATAPPGDAIHATDVPDLLDDLHTIERALLTAWAEKAEQDRQSRAGKGSPE